VGFAWFLREDQVVGFMFGSCLPVTMLVRERYLQPAGIVDLVASPSAGRT